jgi:hypothetical protein
MSRRSLRITSGLARQILGNAQALGLYLVLDAETEGGGYCFYDVSPFTDKILYQCMQ